MKRSMLFLFSLFLIVVFVLPSYARVGSGGGFSAPAVGPRGGAVYGPNGGSVVGRPYGGCCYGGYSGYDIAAPSTGSTTSAGSGPAYGVTTAAVPGTPAFVSPTPAEPSAPIGTIEYSLPNSCTKTFTGGKVYYQCGSTYYSAVYQAGTLVYEAVKAPY